MKVYISSVMCYLPNADFNNDTVRGDPLFSIPLPSKYLDDSELQSIQLCFEIHGQAGKHYNLISDACTSVSAEYSAGVKDPKLNVITEMGVKTQGSNGTCHTIEVHLLHCSAFMDGVYINKTSTVSVNGITVIGRRHSVRVSLPNCERNKRLIMWIMCMKRNNEDMLEFVVARGDGLEPTAHGLVGTYVRMYVLNAFRVMHLSRNGMCSHWKFVHESIYNTFLLDFLLFAMTVMYSSVLQVNFGIFPYQLHLMLDHMVIEP